MRTRKLVRKNVSAIYVRVMSIMLAGLLSFSWISGDASGEGQQPSPLVNADESALLFDGTKLENYAAIQMEGGYYPPTARGSQIVADGDMLRFDLHNDDTNNTDRVRLQAVSPSIINDGDEVWIVNEIMIGDNFPTVDPPNWLTVSGMYGPPYNGTGPLGLSIRNMGAGNVLAWGSNTHMNHGDAGRVMWHSPVLEANKRYTIARRIKASHDASEGFLEIWFAERGHELEQQLLLQNGVEEAVGRRYFATLDASNGGYLNDSRINFYHNPDAPGFEGKITSIYHAEHRIWDATKVEIEDIDPAKREDPEPPTVPANLLVLSKTDTAVTLQWTASTDNVGVAKYDIFVNGSYAASTTATTATVTGLTPETAYKFYVQARDIAGNRSEASLSVEVTTLEQENDLEQEKEKRPDKPKKLKAAAKTDTSVDVVWEVPKKNSDILEYALYIDGRFYGVTTSSRYTISDLSPSTHYRFTVKARNAEGKESKASNTLNVKTSPQSTPFGEIQQLSGSSWNDVNGWLGMKITIGSSPLVIEQLGRWVVTGNSGAHTVKIVEAATGADVAGAAVSVDTSSVAPNQFKYVELTSPIILQANTSYYVVSDEQVGGDRWRGYGTVINPAPDFGIDHAAKLLDGGTWVLDGSSNNSYVPVGFKYKLVAE
ncbi:fibronectin type III domain-containing protein [Paenibacillus sp. GCM10027626]|uniref:fibronectin type III domain-containing protein n=1 Tax=Paenibacillus sp. GCM10027626 TaxID=3273411 RepID=UPI00362B4EFC